MQKNKNIIVIGLLIVGVMVLMYFFRPTVDGENYPFPATAPAPGEVLVDDIIKGDPEASVVLTEYSDFECPACASYYPIISDFMDLYGDQVLFVYRHFPLTSIHQNAHLAGRVAEAAGEQGMFWEMHDEIFENQRVWRGRNARPFFFDYAESLGLNMEQFAEAVDSDRVIAKVQRDWKSGQDAGVRGTPTFFVNGDLISNPGSLAELVDIIESYLEEVGEESLLDLIDGE